MDKVSEKKKRKTENPNERLIKTLVSMKKATRPSTPAAMSKIMKKLVNCPKNSSQSLRFFGGVSVLGPSRANCCAASSLVRPRESHVSRNSMRDDANCADSARPDSVGRCSVNLIV